MCEKSLALWCCMLPLIASSSELWPNSTNDDGEKNYSTVRYQFDANTMRNYNDEKNLAWYNLHENFTKNNNVQYAYRIYKRCNNCNNRKDDHLMQHKFQAHAVARSYENGWQMPEKSRTNSAQTGDENNFMSQEIHRNLKWPISKDGFTSRDYLENFDTEKNKNHIVPYKMCDNIACIRLCCPFGYHLVNRKCIAGQDKFIFLQNMYGYINDSLRNKSKNVDELFLLIVQDPCPQTRKYLFNSYQNMSLVDGSLYLSYYKTIIKSTSYCLAIRNGNIFAVNVCLDIMKKIMKNKTTTHNKTAIFSNSTNENLKRIENTNGSTSYDPFKNYNRDDNKNNIVPYNICDNITCIRLCCPFGNRLINGKCIAVQDSFILLQDIYGYVNNSAQKKSKIIKDDSFLLVVNDPCQQTGYWTFNTYYNVFLLNGSLYLSYYEKIVESTSYCLADMGQNNFVVNVCRDIMKKIINKSINYNSDVIEPINTIKILDVSGQIGLILFLLVIFIVYSMPEFRNMHGYILRRYSGSLVIGYTIGLVNILIRKDAIGDSICIASFVKYYTFLGSWFWLNVMSFDMWRTFRQFCPLQRNTKQQERKKLIMYSVYGWGIPFLLAIICGIMDFVPGISKNLRPEFSVNCWFNKNMPYLLYFHEIVIISIIISICLLVCTARNIAHYKKDIAHLLRDSESRRYNINKQWFNLYLEITKVLFIIICIKSYMYCIYILSNEQSFSVVYTFCTLEIIQNFCIFIIFIWKSKIKKLLLKRFDCHNRKTQHASSNNCTTTSVMISLSNNTNLYKKTDRRAESSSDSTDL